LELPDTKDDKPKEMSKEAKEQVKREAWYTKEEKEQAKKEARRFRIVISPEARRRLRYIGDLRV